MAFPLPGKELDLCSLSGNGQSPVVGGEDGNNTEAVTVVVDKRVNWDCPKCACMRRIMTISYVLSSWKSDVFHFPPPCLC